MTISFFNCVSNNFYPSFNFFSGPKVYWPLNNLPDTASIPVLERNYNRSPLGLMQSRKDCEIFVRNATRRGIWLAKRGKEPESVKNNLSRCGKIIQTFHLVEK